MTSEIAQTSVPDWRSNLPSLEYWRAVPERLPQRFYIAFCLLMSSVQDLILGQKERDSNNLNWSATCSYYSLVHGGRLLCFLALGDYPKRHDQLRDIFSPAQQRRRNFSPSREGYPFDWLRGFANPTGGLVGQVSADHVRSASEVRQMIATHLDRVHVADVEERLGSFGSILAAALPLRNDSNYEALLIAHEFRHETISGAFADLSSHMASAAETTLPFLIDAFNGFRFYDPDLPDDRDQYETFLHVYVRDRIGNAIRQKIAGSMHLEKKLEDTLIRIGTHPTAAHYEPLEEQVSKSMFEGKARLMREFVNRISDLARATRA